VVGLLYGLALAIPVDPEEQRPGLRLSGQMAANQSGEWSEYAGKSRKIWVQTATWYGIAHSVTTISFEVDGTVYVPCRDCEAKRWPRNVEGNPDVTLKIDSKLYERRAVPITAPADLARLRAALPAPPDVPRERVAIFRIDPR